MMWKPSVKAIWLRAASSWEANVIIDVRPCSCRRDRCRVVVPVDLRHVRAVEDLRPAVAPERVRRPADERVDAVADPGHQSGMDAQPGRERDDAVQLVAVRP